MATVYVNDDLLMEYAAEYGSVSDAKDAIQEVIAENAPGDENE